MPPESSEPARIVDQGAIQLFDGHAALHEVGLDGSGVLVGLLDDEITDPGLEPFLARRSAKQMERTKPGPTHGDRMAGAIVRAAPKCRLVTANVFDGDGLVFRSAVAAGIEAITAASEVRLVNVSLEIRRIEARCSTSRPCVACLALRASVDAGCVVVVSAGNHGETDRGVSCPAAEGNGIIVGATVGPQGSSRDDGAVEPRTETGTSVSTAMTTGGIAALLQAFPTVSADELRVAFAATATRLPGAPAGSVGAGRPHFFRALRFLQHDNRGGQSDAVAAEALANDALRRLAVTSSSGPLPTIEPERLVTSFDGLQDALNLAPWSGALHLWLGLLLEQHDAEAALHAATESVRLNWSEPNPHRLLSRLLHSRGDERGARIESTVADLLDDGRQLAAADELFDGLRELR